MNMVLKKLRNMITKIYHKILNLFFEFDIGVYAVKTSSPNINNVKNLKYEKEVICNPPKVQIIKNNNHDLTPATIKTYISPSLLSSMRIRNFNSELNQSIKIKEENLQYL